MLKSNILSKRGKTLEYIYMVNSLILMDILLKKLKRKSKHKRYYKKNKTNKSNKNYHR